jgi:hypothetical protein
MSYERRDEKGNNFPSFGFDSLLFYLPFLALAFGEIFDRARFLAQGEFPSENKWGIDLSFSTLTFV